MIRTVSTIYVFIISAVLYGQDLSNLAGKTFIDKRLEYLKFLNDTTLYSSINSYTDTAKFNMKGDSLFVKQRYLQTDQTGTKWIDRTYSYKIIQLTADTISLKNIYNYSNPLDTLFFVNIDNLKVATSDFKFLRLQYSSPWTGTKHITIDSLGKVSFADNPRMYSVDNPDADKNAKPKNISGQLTQKEFENFKSLLSNSLPLRLPLERDCPIDGATSEFEIIIGTKKINSKGCDLSWTHRILLNYLSDIDQNKGLVKSSK